MNNPSWLTPAGEQTLRQGYLLPGEQTILDAFDRICAHASRTLRDTPALQRVGMPNLDYFQGDLFHALYHGWLGLASPVLANFGATGSRAGLPVSCYSCELDDSIHDIFSHLKECAQLSKFGGGIGVNLSRIRAKGEPFASSGVSSGILPWAKLYDQTAQSVSQGSTRRGSFALYLSIEHPDVGDLLRSKDHSGGDARWHLDSNIALTIPNRWMQSMLDGDEAKRELWLEVMRTRLISGSPYLIFIDAVNRANPPAYNLHGLEVTMSNLCSEIMLHTDPDHTFSCVLSSLNLARYDAWENWKGQTGMSLPELGIWFLDAVTQDFINQGRNTQSVGRAVRSAEKGRPLGLGVLGWHQLLQQRSLPFASSGATELNLKLFSRLKFQALHASQHLARVFGTPEWCEGTGMRNTHLLAIAPTKTNALIVGADSQGIEPCESNFYVSKTAKGTFVQKNSELVKLLREKGLDTPEVWDSIRDAGGSVRGLTELSSHDREVFKTAWEIEQCALVQQAADRQQFICQGQSLNLFSGSNPSMMNLTQLHIQAWRQGLKSVYYLRGKAATCSVSCSTCEA